MTMLLAFDVNETLLDLRALDPLFEHLLGDVSLRPQWFAAMLQLSFVGGLTGEYVDFTTAQKAALRMTAVRRQDLRCRGRREPEPRRIGGARSGRCSTMLQHCSEQRSPLSVPR